jgi:hypothetical protein
LSDFLWDQAEHRSLDLKEFKIYGWDSVLARKDGGDHVIRYQTELYQIKAKPSSVLTLVFKRFTQVLRTDQVFANENFA